MQLPCDTRFSPQHNILILILNNIWAALKSLSFNRSLKVSIIWHHCIGTYIYLGWCRILTEVGLDDICNSCFPSTLVVGGKLVKECWRDYSIIHACPVSCFFRECWRQKLSYSHSWEKSCQPTDMRWEDNTSPGWGVGGGEHGTEDGVTRQGWSCSCDPKLNTRNLGSPAGPNFKLATLGPAWFCPLCLPHHQN